MKQIKTFKNYAHYTMEGEVNKWIIDNKDINIVDIKYQNYKDTFSAMIIYEKGIQL